MKITFQDISPRHLDAALKAARALANGVDRVVSVKLDYWHLRLEDPIFMFAHRTAQGNIIVRYRP